MSAAIRYSEPNGTWHTMEAWPQSPTTHGATAHTSSSLMRDGLLGGVVGTRMEHLPWKHARFTRTRRVRHVIKEHVSFANLSSLSDHFLSWMTANKVELSSNYIIDWLYIGNLGCPWFVFQFPVILPHPREYPVKFGWKIVDLYPDLTCSARGPASFPDVVPPALDSYQGMPDEIGALAFSSLIDVFNYLRQGKHLSIPDDWKSFVPKPLLWPWANTISSIHDEVIRVWTGNTLSIRPVSIFLLIFVIFQKNS